MQIEYQRDLRDHYLVLHGSQQIASDSYRIHMIQENSLRGFTDCHTELVDDEIRYAYRITSMQSLEEMAAVKPAGVKTLQNLFRAAAEALEELELFLLPQDGMLLQPAFIFTDAAQQNFRFCYFPENTMSVSDGMKELSEFLLPHLDEKDRKAVMLGFSFYQVCAAGEMTQEKLKELLYSEIDEAGGSGSGYRDTRQKSDVSERLPPAADAPVQQDLTGEELRARILDDFFSDEEEAESERREQSHRRLLWFLLMTVCALGAAAALALSGWVQTGLGAGILIEAAAIILWRKRGALDALRSRIRQRKRKRKTDTPDWYDEVDADWQTYEERAEELERLETDAAGVQTHTYPQARPALPDSTLFEGGRIAGLYREQADGYPAPPRGGQPDSVYEETVWLGEESRAGQQIYAWLEKTDGRIPLTEQEHMLGKNAEVCDILPASSAVSRMHARLVRQEHGYTVTDLRSRNGTFLNGTMLEAGKAYELQNGDTIRFADATFQYGCSGQNPAKGERP